MTHPCLFLCTGLLACLLPPSLECGHPHIQACPLTQVCVSGYFCVHACVLAHPPPYPGMPPHPGVCEWVYTCVCVRAQVRACTCVYVGGCRCGCGCGLGEGVGVGVDVGVGVAVGGWAGRQAGASVNVGVGVGMHVCMYAIHFGNNNLCSSLCMCVICTSSTCCFKFMRSKCAQLALYCPSQSTFALNSYSNAHGTNNFDPPPPPS